MNNRKIKITFRILRIIFYILFFTYFIITPTSHFEERSICFIYNITGNLCPTCGVTRAFSSLMHLKFVSAFNFNQAFTLILFPISMIIIINDIYHIIYDLISRKETFSYFENIFLL